MAVASETSEADSPVTDASQSLKRRATDAPPSSGKKKIRRTFKKLEIEGDGNCLFRAFSQHFNGGENEYEGVRHRIVKYVEKNWEQFHQKVESVLSSRLARSARQYASYMGKDKTFGSEVEILAASLLFKTSIRVYLKKAKRFLPIYQSSDSDQQDVQRSANPVDNEMNVLYLEYDEDNLHYNVLVPIFVETQILPATSSTTTTTSTSATPIDASSSTSTPKPVSISAASSSSTAVASAASSLQSPISSTQSTPSFKKVAADSPKRPSSVGTAPEPLVTPKALFINKTFDRLDGGNDDSVASAASSILHSPVKSRSGSRGATPTRNASSTTTTTPSRIASSNPPPPPRTPLGRQASSRSQASPIVVRDCYVSLPRTPNSANGSRRPSLENGFHQSQSYRQQLLQRPSMAKPRPFAPPHVVVLCLCSTRDPAFITPVTRAAKRHLSQYEEMRKRQAAHRVTRMRGLDPDAPQEPTTGSPTKEPEAVKGSTSATANVQAGTKTTYSKDIVLWPYLLHSLPHCPNQVFLYHLIFFLFAAAQEADEAFSTLARHVFYMQREDLDKYMTAFDLEFACHSGDTLEKILAHYRKCLKRDVAALRKEWVDMYFAHEEIDHPCKPTDLSSRQNCVIFVLDSRHEEHQRLISRISDHLPYLWKRLSTPLLEQSGISSSIALQNLNSIVDLAVDTVCNDFVDSIVHEHPTKNSILREIRVLSHQIAVATENSFELSVYPKDPLLMDADASSSAAHSLFLLRDRLAELARQSDDLITFERHQIIGDRIADTHLLEKSSSRHRVGLCLPTEDWVEASVFYEKALADLLFAMRTSASNDADRGFLFLPALSRGRRPFHPFVDGAPLRRLARENDYRVEILTAASPVKEPVSIVLIQISKIHSSSSGN